MRVQESVCTLRGLKVGVVDEYQPNQQMTRLKTVHHESTMENQIVIEFPDATFHAYISRPAKLPAPAVVVLQELFGVNADIRATCNELAAQGFSIDGLYCGGPL
jgi:hypothetical protein